MTPRRRRKAKRESVLTLDRGVGASGRAFSLVELVIVIVIMAILAAIALPRASSAASRATERALAGDLRVLQNAIDLYIAEHEGRCPCMEPDGSTSTAGGVVLQRLVLRTDAMGNTLADGPFGPYLRHPPRNPYNQKSTLRLDGAAAGSGLDGWRYDSVTSLIEADHVP